MTEQFNIKVEAKDGELTIRHGEALPLKEKPNVSFNGVINTPRYFLESFPPESRSILLVDKTNGEIVFIGNAWEDPQTKISGNLTIDLNFIGFGLNSDDGFTPEKLAQFLKRRKHYFLSKETFSDVYVNLRNFKAKVNKEIEKLSDDNGNYENNRRQVVESNCPKGFTLRIPIFKGIEAQEIPVEIIVDSELHVSLQSIDALQMEDQLKETIIDAEVELIAKNNPNLCIIYK